MGAPRLGVIVAKRVLRRAVDRNRAKRLIRETFRCAKASLPALDIVVQVRSDAPVAEAAAALWVKLGSHEFASKDR